MNHLKKLTLPLLIVVFLLTFFTFDLKPYIKINGSETGFESNGEDEKSSGEIKNLIIKGAGYYLNSHSDFLRFLNHIELSDLNGTDYNVLKQLLNQAMENMINANTTYYRLTETADQTPYRQYIIDKLLSFDYQGFQKEKGLNNPIFDKAAGYLKTGDIRGVCQNELIETGKILLLLSKVKGMIDVETFPDMDDLWRLNQRYAEDLLFGQYVAEIFKSIINGT